MKRVLVTGANGFVGRALVSRLAQEQNYYVLAAMRGEDQVPASAERVRVPDIADLSSRLAGVDVVVHTAARVHVMRETSMDPVAEFLRINTEATLRLAEDATRAGVRRFIFISSLAVYGREISSESLTEQSTTSAKTPYGKSKLEAEQGLRAIAESTGLEVTILRPPLIYAAHAPGNFSRLLRIVKNGAPLPFAWVDNRRSYVALTNVIDFCLFAIDHPKATNQTFLISDGEDLSTPMLIRAIAKGMNVRPRLLPFPPALLRLVTAAIGREKMFQQLCGSLVIDSSKARTVLGWQPPMSARAALAEAGRLYLSQK